MRRRNAKPFQLVTLLAFQASVACLDGAFTPPWSHPRLQTIGKSDTVPVRHRYLKKQGRNRHQRHQDRRRALSSSLSSMMTTADVFANNNPWTPLYLSALAGASTCLGAAIVFWHPQRKNIGPNTMSFSLALAASVMITVSIVSLGPECLRDVTAEGDSFQLMPLWSRAFAERVVSFGLGCLLYRLLSYFTFPEAEELVLELDNTDVIQNVDRLHCNGDAKEFQMNSSLHHHDDNSSHHSHKQRPTVAIRSRKSSLLSSLSKDSSDSLDEEKGDDTTLTQPLLVLEREETYEKASPSKSLLSQWSSGADLQTAQQRRAWRVAMLLFISLLIHNFPEGLAVAASSVQSTKLGIEVAFGIMIHNIPEGLAIAVPCLAARPDRPWLAFALASGSGLAEPLGAAVALLILRYSQHVLPMENVLAFVAAIMMMVALCDLFPEAKRHDSRLYFAAGTITGVLVMTATELYLPS